MAEGRARWRDMARQIMERDGFTAAAACLEQDGDGVIILPESLMDTRDGREEAIAALQEAFETKHCAAIVIRRGE